VRGLKATGRVLARAPTWHEQRIAEIHAALSSAPENWEGADPPGAYRVFNGLSNDDQIKIYRGLKAADRKKLEENLDKTTGDRSRMYQAIQQAKSIAADASAGRWWTEKSNEIGWAIRQGKFAEFPEGAYWILNGHNEAARTRIIGTLLDAFHLDDLLAHEAEAVSAGVPNVKSIVDEARKARGRFKTPPREKPRYVPATADLDHLRDAAQALRAALPSYVQERDSIAVAVGLAQMSDGSLHLVYATSQNKTSPALRTTADAVHATAWNAEPRELQPTKVGPSGRKRRVSGRGPHGSPTDAEQIMIEAAIANDVDLIAVAPSIPACADCAEALKAEGIIIVNPAMSGETPEESRRLREDVEKVAPMAVREQWAQRGRQFVKVATDPANRLNANQMYQIWLRYWMDRQHEAHDAFERLDNRLRAEAGSDLSKYTEKRMRFDKGLTSALGPEYEALFERQQATDYVISELRAVKDWLEQYVDGMKRSVTFPQVNAKALEIARAKTWFRQYMAPLILFALAGPAAASRSGASSAAQASAAEEANAAGQARGPRVQVEPPRLRVPEPPPRLRVGPAGAEAAEELAPESAPALKQQKAPLP
jgi:hypothetical protein